jgi:hypothetical protein
LGTDKRERGLCGLTWAGDRGGAFSVLARRHEHTQSSYLSCTNKPHDNKLRLIPGLRRHRQRQLRLDRERPVQQLLRRVPVYPLRRASTSVSAGTLRLWVRVQLRATPGVQLGRTPSNPSARRPSPLGLPICCESSASQYSIRIRVQIHIRIRGRRPPRARRSCLLMREFLLFPKPPMKTPPALAEIPTPRLLSTPHPDTHMRTHPHRPRLPCLRKPMGVCVLHHVTPASIDQPLGH